MTDKERRVTLMMRDADELFERSGGGTKHFVRECLHPMLTKHGLTIVDSKTMERILGDGVTEADTGVVG